MSFSTYTGVLGTIMPGQFFFISPTTDNLGMVSIDTPTAIGNGQQLVTFHFTGGSSSGSYTQTYSGAGSFIIPLLPSHIPPPP